MRNKKSIISMAVGSAFAATLGTVPVASAADSPFTVQSLDKGYMLAYADRVDPNKYGGGAKSGEGKSGEGRCGMSMVDANKDGKVSKEEFLKHHEAIFDRIDTNKDGAVDQPEADKYGGGGAKPGPAPQAPHGGMKK
ncbi:EF hand [Nitrosospira sp. Nl5]|uniref:EF-hand domain-containing protein n=1 Tax=Nitrosospira sp. Nl5 TaxID=200120 RepID=UPI000881C25B|nr:EF-hand domain-containing protein [Nitrosospira sp. Nl5]SCY53884.1 EF hand [Nitrosospira sp. Nl5]